MSGTIKNTKITIDVDDEAPDEEQDIDIEK